MSAETEYATLRTTARDVLADLVADPTCDGFQCQLRECAEAAKSTTHGSDLSLESLRVLVETLSTRVDLGATAALALGTEFGDTDAADHLVTRLSSIAVNSAGRPRSAAQKVAAPALHAAAVAYRDALGS